MKINTIWVTVILFIIIPAILIGFVVNNKRGQDYIVDSIPKNNEKIMVLEYSEAILINEANHKILPPGATYDFISADDIENRNLNEYKIILIPSHFFDFEGDNKQNYSKLNYYVKNGGSLIVLLQYNYDWLELPIKFERKLITSITSGNLNHTYYNKIMEHPTEGKYIIQQINKLNALAVHDGFVYPAYGFFYNFTGDALVLAKHSSKPTMVTMQSGSGKIMLIASPWDYHFYRTDIPKDFAYEESKLYYYAILWGLNKQPPVVAYQIVPIGMQILLISIISSMLAVNLLSESKRNLTKNLLKLIPVIITSIGVIAILFTGLSHSEMNKYYDQTYLTDKDFDGLADTSSNIIDMDGLISNFENAQGYHYIYSIFLYLSIIATPFGIFLQYNKNKIQEKRWKSRILHITFILGYLLLGLIISTFILFVFPRP
ncbi:MAG: hypothetical protein KAT05_10810 [Spirochaetes bacterium]|nr:hypothetical protein [Spirochaetota bacterium]